MQNTRLNRLLAGTTDRLLGWLRNPWRRLSVLIISLLLGNFLGTAVSTTTGQQAQWDITVAAILVLGVELINRITYRRSLTTRSILIEVPNALKIGLTYSLFVDALKLGS